MSRTNIVVSVILFGCAALLQGCVLVGAVAAGAYASSVADDDTKAFHAHNLEREKAGLRPLTKEEWETQKPSGEATGPRKADQPK